jgi:hypothetical protein
LNIKEGFCHSCTVLGGRLKVLLEDQKTEGNVSSGVYIHHVLTYNTKKKVEPFMSKCDAATPNANRPEGSTQTLVGFVGVGDDTGDGPVLYTTPDGQFNAGYHIGPEDNFLAWAQIVNYNKKETKVYIAYDLEYIPSLVGVNTKGVLVSVTGCAMKGIKTSNAGPTNTTSGKWTFYEDGNILVASE